MCVYEKEVVEIKKLDKEDNRLVVIYARKSKITHKGDSISNQEEYDKGCGKEKDNGYSLL